jgi:hypothetical protein
VAQKRRELLQKLRPQEVTRRLEMRATPVTVTLGARVKEMIRCTTGSRAATMAVACHMIASQTCWAASCQVSWWWLGQQPSQLLLAHSHCHQCAVTCSPPPPPRPSSRARTGSKYGVRQTRGKFGLGAKMALIWSKKSTGLPIDVVSAHLVCVAASGRG